MTRILVIVTGKFVHSESEADRACGFVSVLSGSPPPPLHGWTRCTKFSQILSHQIGRGIVCVCSRERRQEAGIKDRGTSLGFSVSSPSRFSVRFKEGSVAVKVIQGPEGGGNRKLICKKKGSNAMEVTVR